MTLNRLERAGLVTSERVGQTDKPDRRVYDLTPAGRDQVAGGSRTRAGPSRRRPSFTSSWWLRPRPGLADPVAIVNRQRRELLIGLGQAQRAALAEPDGSVAALLLEGVVLRLQADLRWLEGCARYWNSVKER